MTNPKETANEILRELLVAAGRRDAVRGAPTSLSPEQVEMLKRAQERARELSRTISSPTPDPSQRVGRYANREFELQFVKPPTEGRERQVVEITVRVTAGGQRASGVTVRFKASAGQLDKGAATQDETTGPLGTATVEWTLGAPPANTLVAEAEGERAAITVTVAK